MENALCLCARALPLQPHNFISIVIFSLMTELQIVFTIEIKERITETLKSNGKVLKNILNGKEMYC